MFSFNFGRIEMIKSLKLTVLLQIISKTCKKNIKMILKEVYEKIATVFVGRLSSE